MYVTCMLTNTDLQVLQSLMQKFAILENVLLDKINFICSSFGEILCGMHYDRNNFNFNHVILLVNISS